MLDRVTLQASVGPVALGTACRARRARLAIILHKVPRSALRAGPCLGIAAVAQFFAAAGADAIFERPALFTPRACLGIGALKAAIRLTFHARSVVFLKEACLTLVAEEGTWDGTIGTVRDLTRTIDTSVRIEVVPELGRALLAYLQVASAVDAALHATGRVEDASLGPALVDVVLFALVAREDPAH